MKRKIYIVSESKNSFYELSKLISEFMVAENKTEQEAIDYFMKGLNGTRYMSFPLHTPTSVIRQWITQDMKF